MVILGNSLSAASSSPVNTMFNEHVNMRHENMEQFRCNCGQAAKQYGRPLVFLSGSGHDARATTSWRAHRRLVVQ